MSIRSMIMWFKSVLLILLCRLINTSEITWNPRHSELVTIVQWPLLDYGFPTVQERLEAEANGNLVPRNGVPIDVAPHFSKHGESRIFVTIPRFQTGIPYTLAQLTPDSQQLLPYPSYDWHSAHGTNCDGITSAFRTALNSCNQMWVIDSGMIAGRYRCPPQLLLFDLATNELLHRHRFNSTLYSPGASILVTPIIHVQDPAPAGRCERTMIYVADVTQHGILVYDYRASAAWRVEHKFMYPDPDYGTHTIAGESFTLMDGILGMATDGSDLYFHPLASETEYRVSLRVLSNPNNWINGKSNPSLDSMFMQLGKRGSECAAEAMDSDGNLYCVTLNPIKLISWNVKKPYGEHFFCVLSVDTRLLEFVSGMKVVRNFRGEEELWLLSNRFQRVGAGTQNVNEVNFRILRGSLGDMLKDANCGKYTKDLHNVLIFN